MPISAFRQITARARIPAIRSTRASSAAIRRRPVARPISVDVPNRPASRHGDLRAAIAR